MLEQDVREVLKNQTVFSAITQWRLSDEESSEPCRDGDPFKRRSQSDRRVYNFIY